MNEYVSKKTVYDIIYKHQDGLQNMGAILMLGAIHKEVLKVPAADAQPLSVVAEHIKNRLYETALNTDEAVARDAIADMAERIDFWINELKGR